MPGKKDALVSSILLIAMLTSILVGSPAAGTPAGRTRPNIVFVLIDTLRPDHLGCYGYGRETSPRIDRIAATGVTFGRFYSVCPWTDPTIATLFTGLYPQAVFPPAPHAEAIEQKLPLKLDTLAEILHREGYRTVAVVDHPGINAGRHFDQGFDDYISLSRKLGWHKWVGSAPEAVFEEFTAVLERSGNAPVFLYVHLVYPHRPYTPKPPFEGMFGPGFTKPVSEERQGAINSYDAEIRMTDELVGKMHDYLANNGLLDDTYVLITSDHGEGFWEHGRGEHGNTLFNELLSVPLIMCPPRAMDIEPGTVNALLSNIDLFPTVLDAAGIGIPGPIDGESLLPFLSGASGPAGDRVLFSESPHSRIVYGMACQTEKHKLIVAASEAIDDWTVLRRDTGLGNMWLFFDLRNDPREMQNLAGAVSGTALDLEKALVAHKAQVDARRKTIDFETEPVDERTREQLRSLGYVD